VHVTCSGVLHSALPGVNMCWHALRGNWLVGLLLFEQWEKLTRFPFALIRCFPFHLRSLAIGIQWVLIRTLGTIPGPIIFGYVIDGTCQIWSRTDACNPGLGSCMMYRNQELSFGMLILSFIYKVSHGLFRSENAVQLDVFV